MSVPPRLHTVRVPAREAGSRPLLLVLHGLGDTHRGWEWLPGELDLPWLNYLLVDAPDPYFMGLSWFGLDLPGHPGLSPSGPPAVRAADVDRSRVSLQALLDELVAGGRESRDLAILGFSQGCLMTLEAGLRYPRRLAALVGISGWVHEVDRLIHEAAPAARKVPVLMTHGTWDPLIPCADVERQARALRSAGFDLTWQELEKEHSIAGRVEIGLIRAFLEVAFDRPSRPRPSRGAPEA